MTTASANGKRIPKGKHEMELSLSEQTTKVDISWVEVGIRAGGKHSYVLGGEHV